MAYSVPALATFNLPMNRTQKPCLLYRPLIIFCCCATLLLAACGQTGPLFLPEDNGEDQALDQVTVTEEAVEETIEENEDTP